MTDLNHARPRQSANSAEVEAGQAVYNPLVLQVYDLIVLGISNAWVWQCPTARLRAVYDRNIGLRHLDFGVGTGYYLDKAAWTGPSPDITLADLNENSLKAATTRIARFQPKTIVANALEPFPKTEPFESIGLNYLLHCMPGDLPAKAAVFDNLKDVMTPETRVFGSTILSEGVPVSFAARRLMAVYNRKGVFSNTKDSATDLRAALDSRFTNVRTETHGCVMTFEARGALGAPE